MALDPSDIQRQIVYTCAHLVQEQVPEEVSHQLSKSSSTFDVAQSRDIHLFLNKMGSADMPEGTAETIVVS